MWVALLLDFLKLIGIPLPPNSQPKQCKAGGGGSPAVRVAADGSQANPFLLVANEGSGTLATVDLKTRQVKTVAVGSAPHSVDLTPDGRRAFVGNFGSGDISVVDIPNQRVLETIRVGNQTTALTFDPKTSKLYATNFGDNNVAIVQYREGGSQVVGTVRNVRQPLDVELSPDGRRGYVSSQRPGEGVTVFDTASASVVTRVAIPNAELRKLAVSPDGRRLYAATRTDIQGTGQIAVIDTASLQVIGQIVVEAFPFGLTVTPSGKCLVVTHTVPNRVSFIDVRSREVLMVLGDPADIEPQEIAILGNLAYVTNRVSSTISVFDLGPCQ